MEQHRLRLSAAATIGFVLLAAACTDGPESSKDSSSGSMMTTASSGTSATGSSGTDSGSSSSSSTDGTTGFEITTGQETTTATTSSNTPTNGGTTPLTAEQISAIKEGECAGLTAEAEPIPPVIELVVDVSFSMDTLAPGQMEPDGKSRWDLAQPALIAALDALPDQVAVGLQLFPTASPGGNPRPRPGGELPEPEPTECVSASGRVPIAPLGAAGSAQRLLLANAMNETSLFVGTPTHDAYHNALEEGLKVYDAPGKKFMLLMTDGAPTLLLGCAGDGIVGVDGAPIVAEVASAAAEGIGTFVIGSPGSEDAGTESGDTRPFLSELASVGGTGAEGCVAAGPNFCHFDMTQSPDFSAALAQGLSAIADQVASTCAFAAPQETGVDLGSTSVIVEQADGSAVLVNNDADGDCGEGWMFNAAGEIELCPLTCESVKSSPGAKVSVSLGCADLIH